MHPYRAKSSKAVSGGILVLLFLFSVSPAFGQTITVTNTNDNGAGSLRDTIDSASNGGTNFGVGYPATIAVLTPLTLGPSVNIAGPGGSVLAISGGNSATLIAIHIPFSIQRIKLNDLRAPYFAPSIFREWRTRGNPVYVQRRRQEKTKTSLRK